MTKHTPSTADIRIRYERYREQEQQRGADGVTPVTQGEFERWLDAEVAAAKAEAWEFGMDNAETLIHITLGKHAEREFIEAREESNYPVSDNPYRTERTTDDR